MLLCFAWELFENWSGVTSVESCVVGKSSGHQGVRISNDVEVGEVEYLPESVPAPQIPSTSYSAKRPAKGKRRRSVTPASVVVKRRFELNDDSVALSQETVGVL